MGKGLARGWHSCLGSCCHHPTPQPIFAPSKEITPPVQWGCPVGAVMSSLGGSVARSLAEAPEPWSSPRGKSLVRAAEPKGVWLGGARAAHLRGASSGLTCEGEAEPRELQTLGDFTEVG